MKKHYTIPFFVPHRGCPHQCVFCDQNKITQQKGVEPGEIRDKIESYLVTMPPANARIEVGFFGGTFTGLPLEIQEELLEPVQSFIREGRVHGIRLSTRPDFISAKILSFLKERGVMCVELGVQSMSDKVLSASKRGHLAKDTERSSGMITREGFILGHQMMVGLPESTPDDEYFTARRAKELGASQVRIYPVVVMKGTELAEEWNAGRYAPLDEEEAVERCARLLLYFESNSIVVIRCGLHPSGGLLDGSDLLSGPFHTAFRLKVESCIFSMMLDHVSGEKTGNVSRINFNPGDEAAFFGFDRENTGKIDEIFKGGGDYGKDKNVPRGCLLVKTAEEEATIDRKMIYEHLRNDYHTRQKITGRI